MFAVDVTKVYELIRAGEIPAEKFGTTYRIPNAWVQERLGLDQLDNEVLAGLAALLQRLIQEVEDSSIERVVGRSQASVQRALDRQQRR